MSDKELIENELERDLHLASLGDYPGAAGCKRMAAEITRLRSENADLIHDLDRYMKIANIECNQAETMRQALFRILESTGDRMRSKDAAVMALIAQDALAALEDRSE